MWFWVFVIGGITTYWYLKSKTKKKNMPNQKLNPEKDVVYLVQFPCSPHIRTISPFALKTETYLRLKKVRYEPIYSLKFGRKGQSPYIELNGEQIPDSNIIIKTLEDRGIASKDEPTGQEHTAHMAKVMLENHTTVAGFYWRYGFHMEEFYRKVCTYYPQTRATAIFKRIQPYGTKLRTHMHGLARHDMDEVSEFTYKDLRALSEWLGDKPFFMGSSPATIDCTVFGHLAQFAYMPLDMPQKLFMQKETKNLVDFVDRMKELFWPDWDDMCLEKCMEGHRADTPPEHN